MKHGVTSFLLALLVIGNAFSTAFAEKPNVLIIYGDDQGSIDLGCFGATDLKTPCLDKLATEGILLKQMYAPAPVCSASRVGLLTGRFPARAGQPGNGNMRSEEITIAEIFRDAGYRTGQVGKWHLGKSESNNPGGQGFQHWFGHLGGCIDNYSHFFYWSGPNRHDLFDNGNEIHRPGDYFPDLMAERCKSFIDESIADSKANKPWLLYWAFNAPHYPYQGTKKWLDHYRDLQTPRREYCAFVSTMDERIGLVLDHLEERGLAENTIVIYQPDHGHSTETRAFGGGGNSGPFRGAKFSLFEGGIRVPAIVRFPRKFSGGATRSQFMTACDWLPTIAELCDIEPENRGSDLDGISMVEVLQNDRSINRKPFYWQMGDKPGYQWAVRDGDWKLIANPRDTTAAEKDQINSGRLDVDWFLANLRVDPGERTNKADAEPQRLREMIELGREIQATFGD